MRTAADVQLAELLSDSAGTEAIHEIGRGAAEDWDLNDDADALLTPAEQHHRAAWRKWRAERARKAGAK